MNWITWAILSAVFAAATALLAKVGVAHVDSNLAMALRTSVVVVFAWVLVFAFATPGVGALAEIRSLDRRTMFFLALRPSHRPLVDLLLPRPATGPCLARRAH
jgi:transporter family protein